ncbi:DUF2158 domain-containing protein [Pseudomonas fluorescens]|uniref:DUF2158 domain-containing protein n=1 Tax=Pseudomonas fluorescens TaxID=294 RepID=UPI00123FDB77|nr:DUF2158 domain-containing protein [Pseudomonas fluorescens]VVQ34501.1 hypothetical protein PS947_04075 [Pseudomonas fluorescens]
MADIEDLVSGEIKKGTNIKLNCGGPVMAVHSVELRSGEPNGWVNCQWFAGKKLDSGRFPIESLDVVVPEPEGDE